MLPNALQWKIIVKNHLFINYSHGDSHSQSLGVVHDTQWSIIME